MEPLKEIIHNCETGEITERFLTAEEMVAREEMAAAAELERQARIAAVEARTALKVSAKAKLIAGDPLTEEEASVLVI
jgi:hypothetical protein